MNYDDYKTDSPDQRCADAECAECNGEFFSEDLTDDLCKACTANGRAVRDLWGIEYYP
jgi:hypothetical protein